MGKKAKYDTDVTDTSPVSAEVAPNNEVDVPKEPKAPKLNYHLEVNGVPRLFAKRDWLKREHPTVAATVTDEAGNQYPTTVVIIPAREFADTRVWIQLPNGDAGRFLVPASELDLTVTMDIKIVTGSIKYEREVLRVRPKVERKKKASDIPAQPTDAEDNIAETPEA